MCQQHTINAPYDAQKHGIEAPSVVYLIAPVASNIGLHSKLQGLDLTHWGLVTPHGNIDLSHHWLSSLLQNQIW